jgi:predicted phage-related endonuclease|tara:strand:+ start:5349 stop:6311 length:963 start_codon:yes stop_codon:yes gene_type:complete
MNKQREEWLRERKGGLGGTDVACIICASAKPSQKIGCFEKSEFALWADKSGLQVETAQQDSQAALRGNMMEKYVCDMYLHRLGSGAELVDTGLIWHPINKRIFGTPDGLVKMNGTSFGMDAKTRRFRKGWGKDGSQDIPLDVEVQMRVYMEVVDAPYWDIATFFGLDDLRIYRIQRDRELGEKIIELANNWWEKHITGNEPPPPDGSDKAKEILSLMHQRPDPDLFIEASKEDKEIRGQLLEIKKKQAELKKQKGLLENTLRSRIGDAIGIAGVATWKPNRSSQVFDKSSFRKDNPDLYDKYTQEKPGARVLRLLGATNE